MQLFRTASLTALVSLFFANPLWAAIGLETAGALPTADQAEEIPEMVEPVTRTDWRIGTYGELPAVPAANDKSHAEVRPFGSELFSGGGFAGIRADGLSQDYRVVPGDQITLRLWGAIDLERMQPVDAQGNIFIPSIGPVKVQGLTNRQMGAKVRDAVRTVYPENVDVYTNLQGVQPVAVFVTGYVKRPGHYAGTPDSSVLYFLAQAGGVDDDLGSYRKVNVMRNGRNVARIDLYDFLTAGKLPQLQFRDGDTVVVAEREAVVAVGGDVVREYLYELHAKEMRGAELLRLARLQPDVSHVLLRGGRSDGPLSRYLTVDEFKQHTLRDGDAVIFSSDWRDETIVVQVEGSYFGPSRYALPKDARLHELLSAIAVPENLTDVSSVSVRRVSVAERQKKALMESLRQLETTYLGAPSATPEESVIRVKEAELIQQFVARASNVEPSGRLVVAHEESVADIRLEDGDVITLPEISDSVLISGEVLVPQAVVFKPGRSVVDYIEGAGGYTQHADADRVLVMRRNGEVREEEDVELKPGDEILVLSKAPTKNLPLATTITQILYQIAVAAKVAMDL